MRTEISPPRTLSSPVGGERGRYSAWLEASGLVTITVAAWGVADSAWVHWAIPVRDRRGDPGSAVPFDPSRRAASPDEPPAASRGESPVLDLAEAARLREAIVARWRPRLHYDPRRLLASRLDEPLEAFRRRCLATSPSRGNVVRDEADGVPARFDAALESRELGAEEVEFALWRVGVGWYPSGVAPAAAPDDPMMLDPGGQGR